jgi:hypothetical protein
MPYKQRCKKCQTDKSRCSWRGKSREVIEGEVTITNKRSKGELVFQVDELSSEDKVQVVEVPRGKFEQLYLALQLIKCSRIHRSTTSKAEVLEASMSQGREPLHQTTRATLKVKEAEPMQSKSKGKGKTMVVEEVCKEVRREELERLIAKRVATQEMIDNLQK